MSRQPSTRPAGVKFDLVATLKAVGSLAKQAGNDTAIHSLGILVGFMVCWWNPWYAGILFYVTVAVLWSSAKVINCYIDLSREEAALRRDTLRWDREFQAQQAI